MGALQLRVHPMRPTEIYIATEKRNGGQTMKIALAKEMQQIDSLAASKYGIPEILLMENAGKASADVMVSLLGELPGKSVCVVAGAGNNGGDAFAAARHLANRGATVRVFLLGTAAHMKPAAALNRDICVKMGIDVHSLTEERDWDRLSIFLRFADGVLDGVLGTGFKGALREEALRLVKTINAAGKPVVSIDLPSGVDADSGAVEEEAIRASMTVTLGLPKIGHFFCPGAAYTGRLIVDDIGIPSSLLTDDEIDQEYIDDELARALLKPRPLDVHKGDCGRIMVIAGSVGMTGAAVMASEAALRAGAGIVTLASAGSLNSIFSVKLTEVMTIPLPDNEDGLLTEGSLDTAVEKAADFDTVLIGPGMGRAPETAEFIRSFCASVDKPLVIDADALYAYRGHTAELRALKCIPILTPHLGEMAGLLDITVNDLRKDLLGIAGRAAAEWNSVIVLKSECTLVVCPSGSIWVTSKGNAGMATAGAGDVLAGTIAGLLKQVEPGAAPLLGVYLHGLAGDLAAKKLGSGLTAADISLNIPKARLLLENGKVGD